MGCPRNTSNVMGTPIRPLGQISVLDGESSIFYPAIHPYVVSSTWGVKKVMAW